MQSSALQDLAHPLLDFQALTKILVRKWRDVRVDLEQKEHRLALKGLHFASASTKRNNPEKWRRLGFETESPAWEFGETGFLGMMDLTDFVRKHEDGFQKVYQTSFDRMSFVTRVSDYSTDVLRVFHAPKFFILVYENRDLWLDHRCSIYWF